MSLDTAGVLPPPPGVVPNFGNPPSLEPIAVASNIALAVVSTCFVVLRLYTTLRILNKRGISDRKAAEAHCKHISSSSC